VIDVEIDSEKCFNCGACAGVCPLNLIDVYDRGINIREGCPDCGVCVDVCPVEAITIEE